MGACCSARDRGFKHSNGLSTLVARLHVQNGKQDYRISRVLKLMLETRGKSLIVLETSQRDLPEIALQFHPILEYDGRVLSGEFAITQYVAYREKFYPGDMDPAQLYYVESLVAEVKDLWELVTEGREEGLEAILPALERRLDANGVHFIGKSITIADIYVYDFLRKSCARSNLPDRLQSFLTHFETELRTETAQIQERHLRSSAL